jgi:hypothetical protein
MEGENTFTPSRQENMINSTKSEILPKKYLCVFAARREIQKRAPGC